MSGDGASPYSTGGGGVRLEHRYAATLLAALLAGDPITELGDDVVPLAVRLQASELSPVDDLVVDGWTSDGEQRRVSIGVRRAPALTTSDTASIPLVRSFLRVVTKEWDEVAAGRWWLALAVGVFSAAVQQTAELARLAQSVPSAADFRAAVGRRGATNQQVRARLIHLDALVSSAADGEDSLSSVAAGELTWRWLSALRVRGLRLEGVDESDRTVAVRSLRRVLAGESVESADTLFGALAERAGAWASAGALVDAPLLRRTFRGYALSRSTSYAQAWDVLDRLAQRLRDGVRPYLEADTVRLELNRDEERAALRAAMTSAGAGFGVVVTGEPDVGKSALTLRVSEAMREEGVALVALSLRDLPASVVEVEALLGASLPHVLASGEVRPVSLLIVDGAEAVLEGRREVFDALARGAFAAGIGVVAVTRTDGSTRASEVLREAAAGAGISRPTAEHRVGMLSRPERDELVATFTSLARLGSDARVEWLVGRPGLVAALLRSGPVVSTDAELLSEADVFVVVWNGLVRRHEEQGRDGTSADEREQTILAVARRSLGLDSPLAAGQALPGLRSDGVLRAPANPAVSTGEDFATDLMRDFALCRLFLRDGWEPLRHAGAPRWTIRAVRLACQVRLLDGDRSATWAELRSAFLELSASEGERWAEVPVEALLTIGDAQVAIDQIWPVLAADNGHGIKTLLRLAGQRYVSGDFGDPFALAPVVAVTFCSDHDLGQRDLYSRGTGEQVRQLVLAWLRGMVRDDRGPDSLRQQVRDRILEEAPRHDEFAVEALASLGADTDDVTEQWLRKVATEDPYRLRPAVESFVAGIGLSQVRPELLIDLSESYFIENPDPEDHWGSSDFGDGIRDHQHGNGLAPPFAAWFYGPFFRLLNTRPVETVAMINRMLDHAARDRVDRARRRGWLVTESTDGPAGLAIELPELGLRHYIGDSHVWGWYRGSTVGPYPCMSALLATERFADHLIDTLSLPAHSVVLLLLRDCNNLAMPGLVFGLLARHAEKTATLLEPWLAHPEVWHLEFARATGEGHLHVQGPDADDVPGRQRRRSTPRDLAAEMTVRAVAMGDQARLERLAVIGDRLVAHARDSLGEDVDLDEPDIVESLAVVQGWAATLRPENYATRVTDDGVLVQFEPPEHVAQVLAPTNAELAVGNRAVGLQLRYAVDREPEARWSAEELTADIILARQLAAEPPARGPLPLEDPIAAVAAAAIACHNREPCIAISGDDLQWAADTVLTSALTPRLDMFSYESTTYPMGADRSAARSVPLLLLPEFGQLGLDSERVAAALTALGGSLFDEVRTAFAGGCAAVWSAPCSGDGTDGRPCAQHLPAWTAVLAGLSGCRLGGWDQHTQRRDPEPLPPPHVSTLPGVPGTDLLVNRLAMPLACTSAASTVECLSREAEELLQVLLDAHVRGVDHWMRKGYGGYRDAERQLVARVLVEQTAGGDVAPLRGHLRGLAANANALQQLLHDLMLLFTYDAPLRRHLPGVWDVVLATTLDAIEAGADLLGDHHWVDYALGALLPTPQLRPSDPEPDATLEQARADWLPMETVVPYVERWIRLAVGEPKAADAVAQLARTASSDWQELAMTWVEGLVAGNYDRVANQCWYLTRWLGDLRETLATTSAAMSQWRRIVDGLAGSGDSRAVSLQRMDE